MYVDKRHKTPEGCGGRGVHIDREPSFLRFSALKENPLRRTDLDDFVACYNPKNRYERNAAIVLGDLFVAKGPGGLGARGTKKVGFAHMPTRSCSSVTK
jgi:hypothetical protein